MTTEQITTTPRKVAGVMGRAYVQFQVQGAGTVYYANTLAELSQNTSGQQGFSATQADGIQRLWMNKELWMVASALTQVSLDVAPF